MRLFLLAAALAFAVPAPADAQRGPGFTAGSGDQARGGVRVHRGGDFRRDDRGDFRRDDRRRGRDRGDVFFAYRDYQGDSLWRPESFNDWWHERPNRAYPAWVARNTNCERMWWSGGDWRC